MNGCCALVLSFVNNFKKIKCSSYSPYYDEGCKKQCCSKAKDLKVEAKTKAKDMQVEAKAKDINQGQRTFFRFQYEISIFGSFGHEIMVRKQFMA